MTDTSQDTGSSMEATTEAFERLLDSGKLGETSKSSVEREVENEAEDDESEALQDDLSETPEDSEDDESEDDTDTDDDSESDDDDESIDISKYKGKKVPVTINGETKLVPLEEAIKGYQRQADYSRKTAELAANRSAFEAEAHKIAQERQAYNQVLNTWQQHLNQAQAKAQNIDWNALRQQDPLEYAIRRADYQDMQAKQQALGAERARLAQQQAVQQAKVWQNVVSNEQNLLHEKMPQWKDGKVWERDRTAMRQFGLKLGYTEQELSSTADHRAVIALYNAMNADRIKNKKGSPVHENPSSPKTMPTGSAHSAPKRSDAITKASQRLKQSGSIDDATNVFEQFLKQNKI